MANNQDYTIRVKRGTANEWAMYNPILGAGELGYDTTNKRLKVGDGLNVWSNVKFATGNSFDVARDAGFDGTLSEWLESLREGPANTLEVGDVQVGGTPTATIRGEAPNQIIDFVFPGPSDPISYGKATPTKDGLMPKEDKATLDSASSYGKDFLASSNAVAARSKLGLGTGALSSSGTEAELSIGTETASRVWSSKTLADYIKAEDETLRDDIKDDINNIKTTTVNVEDYGAVGDGTTDNTAAIQSWLNNLNTDQIGYMPEGVYRVTSKVTISKSVVIKGNNAEIFMDGNGRTIETVETDIDFSIDGITIRGTLTDSSTPADLIYQRGLFLRNTGNIKVTNCTFKNIHNTCIQITDPKSWIISGCLFDTYGYCGASIRSRQRGGMFVNNICVGTGILPSFDVNSYACSVTHSSTTERPSKTIISNNIVINQAWEALDTHGGYNIIFSNNILYEVEAGIVAVELTGAVDSTPTNILITGNVIDRGNFSTPRQAIGVEGASTSGTTIKATGSISNNIIKGYGIRNSSSQYVSTSIYIRRSAGFSIANNYIESSYGSAIRLFDSINYLITGNNVVGILEESGVSDNKKRFITIERDSEGYVLNNIIFEGSYTPVYRNVLQASGTTNIKGTNNSWDSIPTITPS